MKGNVFIKRPVMAISISVLILAIGLISLFTLPVEQYPDIAPPTVNVFCTYPGANADVIELSVPDIYKASISSGSVNVSPLVFESAFTAPNSPSALAVQSMIP